MTTATRATLAAAHRVVDGVHGDATLVRALAEPAIAAGLAERDVLVVEVRDLADGRAAVEVDLADLRRRQANLGVLAVLRHQRRGSAGGANELAALALAQLDVVDEGAEGDEAERERVARLDVSVPARDDLVADLDAVGSKDVALLAVQVVEEREAGGPAGIVLDGGNVGRNANLVAAEVDNTVALLVATPAEAGGDASVVVSAARAVLDV